MNATFKDLGWENSVTLNGYKPGHTLYLPIAKYTRPQKIVLHLKAKFSPLLNENTRLDIKLNQTVLRRIALPADVTQEFNFDVELPLSELSTDWQALDFMAYFADNNQLCNPNLWIYISPASSITVTTLNTPFSGTLNQLPGLFINPISLNPISPMLLLPQQASRQEIFAALKLAFYLGTKVDNSAMNLNTKNIHELTDTEKDRNFILIGTTEHLIASSIIADPILKTRQAPDAGFLKLEPSFFNEVFGLLTIGGDTNEALNKAIDALILPEFKQMATGQVVIVDHVNETAQTTSRKDWYQSTFKELGYQDLTVSGLGQSKLIYTIPLPNDLIPVNSTLKTYITAPGFNPLDRSQITLLVNGLKQSSFDLVKEHSAWKVDIDPDAMKPGINTLEYQINLHLKNESCTIKDLDEVWATIHSETEFNTLFLNEFPKATLNQLPVPFNSEITLIVPDELSARDITNLTRLMFTFGKLMRGHVIPFNFVNSSAVDEEYVRNNNVIIYGTTKNRWIKFAFNYVPFALVNKDGRSLALPQKNLVLSGQKLTGLLELVSSPWNSTTAVFLISGVDEASLSRAVRAFTNDKSRLKLDGNIALINSDQSIHAINSEDTQYISLRTQVWRYLKNSAKNMWFYVKYHPQIFIYLLVFIVPLYIYLRQRKK
ncbi:cellulose biosynthesis cyclic di-GMP-binding regulatory protein BcsB [Legionella shakespearei]|uniref:Cyclic di-GMP-binding protein n=2 Tax=Legionella shakespearei TaxID=45075 RepID=A0A0W0YT43_9GAMM|nr:cellulose biosynthesis cyclic di-GMP-binding regulatory protein BcsB [Legionella shakespearei]KTD60066.1 cellulose synthase regulator protein [Legionella shakespearei DSM 23087]